MDADSLRANVRQVVDEKERFCKTCRLLWWYLVKLNVKERRARLCCPSLLLVISSCTLAFVGKV